MRSISIAIDEMKDHYEVVVIGSGYGGGVSASRLARAGRQVCLLERGREILLGDFPDTLNEVVENTQFHTPDKHVGSHLGLYDIHVNKQQNIVVGCGLGGTSLINANVSLEAKTEVFNDPIWPLEIREHSDTVLQKGYRRAHEMLKPVTYPEDRPSPAKMKAHQKSAQAIGQEFYRTPINVTFQSPEGGVNHVGVEQQACNDCGDCVSGCNYGAKNTTQMNYLPDAWNHGADIVCQAEVRYLEKVDDGWLVHFQYVDVGRESFDAPALFVRADLVVVSAGTLGSNEILLRSKAHGLAMSERVGMNFSGNGDILGFGYNCDEKINSVGYGTHDPGELEPVGPCITSVIDMRHGNDWRKRMIVEEGSVPGAMAVVLPVALAVAQEVVGKDTDDGILDAIREKARIVESNIRGAYHGAVNHTQTYLIMSHDNSRGQARLNDHDRLEIDWPGVGLQPNFIQGNDVLSKVTSALGGTYVKNPIWTPLFKQSLVTVHPLGGCNMAVDAAHGVVNHKGQVFVGSGNDVYDSLYVTDGSVIPISLGVNPLLTITAISERCVQLMAEDRDWVINYQLSPVPVRSHPERHIGIRFTETMKGYFSKQVKLGEGLQSYRTAASQGKLKQQKIEFTLTIDSHNLDYMLQNESHEARISGTITCDILSPYPLVVSKGVFNLFERMSSPPDTRHMIYTMRLHSESGDVFYFKGYKLIKNKPNAVDIWPDTSTLYVTIYQGEDESSVLGKAVMHIEPVDFARQMTTMCVTNATNITQRLKATARFGKFFAGVLWENYGGIFYDPARTQKPPRKKRPLRVSAPQIYAFTTDDGVNLRLTRYQGGDKGPVMLVHGLGVSSSIFSTDLIDTNLLEYLYANGYDVWLLDYRVSISLPAATEASNGDQVARYDYPAAIENICSITGAADVQVLVHCYGGTTFFMSMLAGLQGVRSIVCSQVATNLVVPSATRIKTGLHVPSFLDKLGVKSLTAKLPEDGGSPLTYLYDKALDLYAMTEAQGNCSDETCHRITFMYAPLYKHENLNEQLHQNLDELFAESNMETFEHLAEMCRQGKLVSAEGEDLYMPNLERLRLPILFISGEDNECYLPESTQQTYDLLRLYVDPSLYQREVIPNYGHIDCIFGNNAVNDVYPIILQHLDKSS